MHCLQSNLFINALKCSNLIQYEQFIGFFNVVSVQTTISWFSDTKKPKDTHNKNTFINSLKEINM